MTAVHVNYARAPTLLYVIRPNQNVRVAWYSYRLHMLCNNGNTFSARENYNKMAY